MSALPQVSEGPAAAPASAHLVEKPLERIVDWLRHCAIFSHLDPRQLQLIAAQCQVQDCAKGVTLFSAGTVADGFHVVVIGAVALHLPGPNGDEKLVEIISAGDSFGLAAMFLEIPFPVASRCMTHSLVLRVPKEPVFELIDQNPSLARKMLAGMSLRMHRLIHDIEGYAFRSAAGRLADFLLNLPAEDDGCVYLPMSKGELASKLLITPETLSRVLHAWAREGVIEIHQRRIQILNRTLLQTEIKRPA